MRLRALAVFASLALGACAHDGIDSAAKADVDGKIAAIKVDEQTFPPSESYSPMAFVVGQWTQHKVVDAKGQPSLLTYKLTGQENGGYWVEIVDESYRGRVVTKIFVTLTSRDPAGMDIRSARMKVGDAPPVDLEGAAGEEAAKKLYASLDLLAIAFEPQLKDDAKVPAGHFIGCYTTQTPGPWGPWRAPSEVCVHPAVPLSGIVRAKPVGGAGSIELVGFGMTGAGNEI
ncbi:MAG TPA: hypothetical protein VHJ20_15800 [Polyangia bacterium]|nr:hypothetical protein [Polyangia bacterium]